MSMRDQAELLALELDWGIVSPSIVIAWADAIIEQETHPHWSVCEVSTMSRANVRDLSAALRQVPGEPGDGIVKAYFLLALADHALANVYDLERIVSVRYVMNLDELVEHALSDADAALELRECGVSNDSREAIADALATTLRSIATGSLK